MLDLPNVGTNCRSVRLNFGFRLSDELSNRGVDEWQEAERNSIRYSLPAAGSKVAAAVSLNVSFTFTCFLRADQK